MYGIVSFGGGSRVWLRAGRRLAKQLNDPGLGFLGKVYDAVPNEQANQSDLEFIRTNNRGYGYWIWKPMVILDFLKENQTIDFVVYLDAGCEIAVNQEALMNFFGKYQDSDAVVFYMPDIIEEQYSKSALLKYLNVTSIHSSQFQISATVFCMRRSFAESFSKKWLEVMRSDEFALVNDSLDGEIDSFIAHRHDQSVFSLLIKNLGDDTTITRIPIHVLDSYESPFRLARNRSSISSDKTGVVFDVYRFIERVIDKLFNLQLRVYSRKRRE